MKAAIITGAGSGIGKATALEFSKNGYFVYLIGRNKEKLEEVAMLCRSGARRYGCDLTHYEQIEKTAKDILSHKDTQIEVLVNNAAIYEKHEFTTGGVELWQKMFETNLLGPIKLTQYIYQEMKKNKKGTIVNVSSTLGLKPIPETSAYSASKSAMNSWTQALALEAGAFNIRVNAVCPGIVDTPIHPFYAQNRTEKNKTLEMLNPMQPMGRIGQPEEIAQSIYFLASDQSSWTTGALLVVDGGINIA
jgi:NAD(P)-dependent dehydrogenase (short-subunit alcohol dehydrogenase family)